jgi:pectate lyase
MKGNSMRQPVSVFFIIIIFLLLMLSEKQYPQHSVYADDKKTISEDTHSYFIRPLPEPMGFATIGSGITGGAGGTEVTVTNAHDLFRYATRSEPYIINVADTIEIIRGIGNFAERNGAYYIASNTTIRGVGPNATILYGAFRLSGIQNVIIQNLTFDGTYNPEIHDYKHQLGIGERGPANDAIEITGGSENIWVTQNTFKRYSDECLSINNAASNVTLSWNRFDDLITGEQGMMILIGSGDGQTQDIGRLNTTLHHNYMASRSRHPRTRFGKFHIFNNYYHNIPTNGYGIASTMDAQILVEGNYFENVNNAWHIGFGSSAEGYLVERDNIFMNTVVPVTRGQLGQEVFIPTDYYEYTSDNAEDIPSLVLKNMGAGNWDYTSGDFPVPGAVHSPVRPKWGAKEPLQPVFIWNTAFLAEGYRFELETVDGVMLLDTTVTDTVFAYPGILEDGESYYWRVKPFNQSGGSMWMERYMFSTSTTSSIDENGHGGLPPDYMLENNYPNPFNPDTIIRYAVPEQARVNLRVYDLAGREISVLVDDEIPAGYYTITFNGTGLSSGMYIYRLIAQPRDRPEEEKFINTHTMTFLR